MLLLLLIATVVATTTPGTGLELPAPAPDPKGQWLALVVAVLPVIGSIVAAKIQAKRGQFNGLEPLFVGQTPRLDVGQEYLERYVQNLDDQINTLKIKNDDLEQKFLQVLEDRATIRAQLEAMRVDNIELRDEINVLRGRLRGRRDD